jgi:protein with PEP-CTERM/exosortase system signal
MKIKTLPAIKLSSLLCTAVVSALLMFSNRASAISIRDARELPLPRAGTPSRYSDGSTYTDNLIDMALRSNERANGEYFRSNSSTKRAILLGHMNPSNGVRRVEFIRVPGLSGFPRPGSGTGVPDGGITAMLLGAALSVLGMARRYMMS